MAPIPTRRSASPSESRPTFCDGGPTCGEPNNRSPRKARGSASRTPISIRDLSLNGFVGFAANDFKDLFASKSFIGFVFPTINWTILNYGRIRNNIRTRTPGWTRRRTSISRRRSMRGAKSKMR